MPLTLRGELNHSYRLKIKFTGLIGRVNEGAGFEEEKRDKEEENLKQQEIR